MTAALDGTGDRATPARIQVPITHEFAQHYHEFVQHARASGTSSAENVRALVELANQDPGLRERMQELSHALQEQRSRTANAARAAGMRRARAPRPT